MIRREGIDSGEALHSWPRETSVVLVEAVLVVVDSWSFSGLGQHLVTFEGVKVLSGRETVDLETVAQIVILAIEHVWLVQDVVTRRHIGVVGWHRGEVSAK